MNEAVFIFMALCCCVFATLCVTVRDVFHSALWLALTLLSISGIYFYLDAQFVGVVQVLIYVGAIVTLFIFAIKLTAKIGDSAIRQTAHQFWPGLIVTVLLMAILVAVISQKPWGGITPSEWVGDLQTLGRALITTYALPFEFISLLLLAALVGAIVIGKVKK